MDEPASQIQPAVNKAEIRQDIYRSDDPRSIVQEVRVTHLEYGYRHAVIRIRDEKNPGSLREMPLELLNNGLTAFPDILHANNPVFPDIEKDENILAVSGYKADVVDFLLETFLGKSPRKPDPLIETLKDKGYLNADQLTHEKNIFTVDTPVETDKEKVNLLERSTSPVARGILGASKTAGNVGKVFDAIPRPEAVDNALSRFKTFFDKHSFRLQAMLGAIGHVFLGSAGLVEGDSKRVSTASLYMATQGLQISYGNGTGTIDFHDIMEKMRHHFKEQGIELPDTMSEAAQREIHSSKPLTAKTKEFVERNPFPISMSFALSGNAGLIASGYSQRKWNRMMAGVAAMTGGLTGVFVKETPLEEQELPEKLGLLETVAAWVRERPLRFLGGLLLTDNVFMLRDALDIKRVNEIRRDGGTDKDGNHIPSHKERIAGADTALNQLLFKNPELENGITLISEREDIINGHIPHPNAQVRIAEIDTQLETMREAFMGMGEAPGLSMKDRVANLSASVSGMATTIAKGKNPLNPEENTETILSSNASPIEKALKLKLHRNILATELKYAERGGKFAHVLALANTFAWMASSATMAMSSKARHGSLETNDFYEEMYARCAQMVLRMPESKRDEVITRMASWLPTHSDVKVDALDSKDVFTEIEQGIRKKLDLLADSPFYDTRNPEQFRDAYGNLRIMSQTIGRERDSFPSPAAETGLAGVAGKVNQTGAAIS